MELIIGVAVLAIIVAAVWYYFSDNSSETKEATRGVLPGTVNVVCIDGFEYLYVESRWEGYARAGLATRWNEHGLPSRCSERRSQCAESKTK
jgi:hypothetical protein